jgi:uncharacterized membrane protein HdeD (DUF308 family)
MALTLVLLALGIFLILAALWDRSVPRRSFILFVLGALVVVAGGLSAIHGVELP